MAMSRKHHKPIMGKVSLHIPIMGFDINTIMGISCTNIPILEIYNTLYSVLNWLKKEVESTTSSVSNCAVYPDYTKHKIWLRLSAKLLQLSDNYVSIVNIQNCKI